VVVNGFVQISAAETTTPGYVSMAQDSTSFMQMNTAYSQEKWYCPTASAEKAAVIAGKAHSRVNLPDGTWYNPPISTNLSQP